MFPARIYKSYFVSGKTRGACHALQFPDWKGGESAELVAGRDGIGIITEVEGRVSLRAFLIWPTCIHQVESLVDESLHVMSKTRDYALMWV